MPEFNKDELVPPTWLDNAFFERALRSYKRDATIKVKDAVLTPGTKPGDHYASIMFRANITYSSKVEGDDASLKVILKTMPQVEGHKMEFLKNSPAFKSEAKMYSTILPEMERLLRVAGDSTVFAPQIVYQNVLTEPSPVIVLEDISPDGWVVFNDGINDWEQVQLITEKLGKFHALSIYMNENGFPLDEFDNHYWCDGLEDDNSMIAKFVKPGFINVTEKMKDWPGFEKYHKKLVGKCNHYCEQMLKVFKGPSKVRVLNHGDFHAKNMMFRHEGKKDSDIIFIDYQFPIWTSPSLDILYIFTLLADDRLADEHRDEIIRVYYDQLRKTLESINYRGQIPTMLDLQVSFLEAAPLDLMNTFMTVPPRLFNFREMDFDEMMGNIEEAMIEFGKKVHDMPEYRAYLLKRLTRLELTGVMN